jgi:putative nucleotidyltransferase with HDIG domain
MRSLRRLNRKNGKLAKQPLALVQLETDAISDTRSGSQTQSGTLPLPWTAKALSVCAFAAGIGCMAYFLPYLPHSGLAGLVFLALAAVISERIKILVYGDSKVSVTFVCLFAVALLYGPSGIAVAAPLAVLSLQLPRRLFTYQFMFNFGDCILADTLTALVLLATIGNESRITLSGTVLGGMLAGAAVNYAMRSTLVSVIASSSARQSPWSFWRENLQWVFPHYLVFGFLGLALAIAYQQLGVTGLLAFAAPPLMMRVAIKQYVDQTTKNVAALKQKNDQLQRANHEILSMSDRLRETYDATLEALAAALDARDSETGGHSSRVTVYTMDMAKELGVVEGSEDWLNIERASLLHDVGKIGVSDAILNKPGPLTAEEWQQMRKHPAIGFEMLKDVKFLATAAEIVYTHHERYDGRGYPCGLEREDIPLGARIFAVADAFDAMTSDRPYRRALSVDKASEEITHNSGTQFDPAVVKAFLRCLPAWTRELAESQVA